MNKLISVNKLFSEYKSVIKADLPPYNHNIIEFVFNKYI